MSCCLAPKKVLIVAWAVLLGLLLACTSPPPPAATSNARVDVSLAPVQKPTRAEPITFARGRYHWTITPKAEYEINAEVKGTEEYSRDWNSILSPVDFALAWQDLTRRELDRHISYSQSNRWYHYRYAGGFPRDKRYIIEHSANHHILPANNTLERAVLSVDEGDRIRLKGYLVNVDGIDGDGHKVWWRSSLTRSDEGDGSCEVFWVTEMQKGSDIYR